MMSEKSPGLLKGLGIGNVAVQLFDIAIHAATAQLEPLRVASNLIILAWVFLIISGRLSEKIRSVTIGSVGAYLGLNIIFLILEGVTNPNTGAVRGMLFLLVILTTTLSIVLARRFK